MTEFVWAVMAMRLLRNEVVETDCLRDPYIDLCRQYGLEATRDRGDRRC